MNGFTTKQKGDVAEYRVITELLQRGFDVLTPCGDRLPYDLAIDLGEKIIRVQVKLAWFYVREDAYKIDVRRSQTNRRVCKKSKYSPDDFDFLIAWIADLDVFYVFPSEVACTYAGEITMVEGKKRQRPPAAAAYREAWDLIK